MRGLWDQINHDSERQAPSIEKLVRSSELRLSFELLREEGRKWLTLPAKRVPARTVVTQLAEEMSTATVALEQFECCRGITTNTAEADDGSVNRPESRPACSHTDIVASDYRFRLRLFASLAAQWASRRWTVALDAIGHQSDCCGGRATTRKATPETPNWRDILPTPPHGATPRGMDHELRSARSRPSGGASAAVAARWEPFALA